MATWTNFRKSQGGLHFGVPGFLGQNWLEVGSGNTNLTGLVLESVYREHSRTVVIVDRDQLGEGLFICQGGGSISAKHLYVSLDSGPPIRLTDLVKEVSSRLPFAAWVGSRQLRHHTDVTDYVRAAVETLEGRNSRGFADCIRGLLPG